MFGVGGKHTCPVELEADFQIIRNLVIVTCINRHFAEFLMFDVALFIRVTYTQIETMFGRSSRNAYIIVGDKSCLEDFILPVGICIPAGEVERGVFLIGELLAV